MPTPPFTKTKRTIGPAQAFVNIGLNTDIEKSNSVHWQYNVCVGSLWIWKSGLLRRKL
jgi:hypothetical protein